MSTDKIFRTPVAPLNHRGLISHSRHGLMLGSCFSDNIGERLRRELFNVTVNPFGTLYNPASIAQALERIAGGRPYTADELVEHEGRWHSMQHHSSFSSDTAEGCLAAINASLAAAHERLKSVEWCVITLGSAWVWTRDGDVVANCHKLPASQFRRMLLTVEGAEQCLDYIMSVLDPSVKVIFTISPIRHKGDGAHGNQISKSTLILAAEHTVAAHPGRAIYFPSYEVMMDDLRDYRFYAADMRHPSETAIEYIYTIFCDSFFTPATATLACECHRLWERLSHRPLAGKGSRQAMLNRMAVIELARKMAADHPELQEPIAGLISTY